MLTSNGRGFIPQGSLRLRARREGEVSHCRGQVVCSSVVIVLYMVKGNGEQAFECSYIDLHPLTYRHELRKVRDVFKTCAWQHASGLTAKMVE